MIGLDLETTALTPAEGRWRLAQAYDGERTLVVDADKADPTPLFEKVASEGGVAHNANFEELWMREHYGVELPAALEDTMVMSQVLYGGTEDRYWENYVLSVCEGRGEGIVTILTLLSLALIHPSAWNIRSSPPEK